MIFIFKHLFENVVIAEIYSFVIIVFYKYQKMCFYQHLKLEFYKNYSEYKKLLIRFQLSRLVSK